MAGAGAKNAVQHRPLVAEPPPPHKRLP
jgi:hypothetical protein